MRKAGKILAVYFSFLCVIFGFGIILFPQAPSGSWVGAVIAPIGLTFFWFQFKPLS
jgi:hypothetical protein